MLIEYSWCVNDLLFDMFMKFLIPVDDHIIIEWKYTNYFIVFLTPEELSTSISLLKEATLIFMFPFRREDQNDDLFISDDDSTWYVVD